MERHPIESLMSTTMENIKDMVDVNTVIGDPVRTEDGSTIIPISRVSFGFLAGGGEYSADGKAKPMSAPTPSAQEDTLPFAGGSGAGVSVNPMGFLVVGNGQVRLLSANYITPVDRVMELLPQVIADLKTLFAGDEGNADKPQQTAKTGNPPAFTTPEVYSGTVEYTAPFDPLGGYPDN